MKYAAELRRVTQPNLDVIAPSVTSKSPTSTAHISHSVSIAISNKPTSKVITKAALAWIGPTSHSNCADKKEEAHETKNCTLVHRPSRSRQAGVRTG